MNLTPYTWQYTGDDNWRFGIMVRGFVRSPVAEVYFDEDRDDSRGGWVWMTYKVNPGGGYDPNSPRGVIDSLEVAIAQCERAVEGFP